jgi:hypothetical protein
VASADLTLESVALTSLSSGEVAQVTNVKPVADERVAADWRRAGLCAGTRLSVEAIDGDGALTVKAARGTVSVAPADAAAIRVVPGDLAAISDRVARDAR